MSHKHSRRAQTPCWKPTHLTVASAAPTKRTRTGSAITTSSPASEPVRIGSIQQPRSRSCGTRIRLLQLRHLTLATCYLTIAGYKRVASMQLWHLVLSDFSKDYSGKLELIVSMKQLQHLHLLCSLTITNAFLVSVASLQALRHLDLRYCYNVAGDKLVYLASLHHLQHLNLGYCYGMTDAVLVSIASLQQLRHLGLNSAHITDAGCECCLPSAAVAS